MVLISRHVGHSISDSPSTASAPIKDVLRDMAERLRVLGDHSEVETTILLCAKYLFEHEGSHPLVSLLPPLLHLRSADVERQPQLQLSIQLLRLESAVTADGSELVVPRILDSLLVFLLRAWIEGQPAGKGGWFGALRDPGIHRALGLIHARPHAEWTVESLAAGARQSRATFARRFMRLVGKRLAPI